MPDFDALTNYNKINEKLDKFFKEVIGPDLPHATSQMAMIWGTADEAKSFDGHLSGHNLFKDSVYEYKGPNDFLHFTSVQSLNSILKQGFIRSSEFRHLADRHELAFASKAIDWDFEDEKNEEIEHQKETIFSTSLCEYNETTLVDQFMWMQYANAAKGVALRIKLHIPEHQNGAIGKVIYGEDGLNSIKNIVQRAKTYKKPENIFPSNFQSLLVPILAYHKVGAFSNEKEIRLLFKHHKNPYEKHKAAFIFQDINSQNNLRYFYPIFLKEKKHIDDPAKADLFNLFKGKVLTLEITDIYFGRNVEPNDLIEFHDYFSSLKKELGYNYSLWRLTNDNKILPTF